MKLLPLMLLALAVSGFVACDSTKDAKQEKAQQAHLLTLAQCVCANKGGIQLMVYDFGTLRFVCKEDRTVSSRYVTFDMTCYQ